ncbi:MAG TPA: LuxR C-terminal-related transcriptional regulator, partial [Sphingomonas sp.]|nr:LuxR C-terminal-related transcriptional regulator [Sphingomonas sp.]
ELLGLTAAEAAIAARLADGSALADIAAELGIAHNTARAHLRAIYAKTGVNRQSRLVHLIHHSLAGLSADRM